MKSNIWQSRGDLLQEADYWREQNIQALSVLADQLCNAGGDAARSAILAQALPLLESMAHRCPGCGNPTTAPDAACSLQCPVPSTSEAWENYLEDCDDDTHLVITGRKRR